MPEVAEGKGGRLSRGTVMAKQQWDVSLTVEVADIVKSYE